MSDDDFIEMIIEWTNERSGIDELSWLDFTDHTHRQVVKSLQAGCLIVRRSDNTKVQESRSRG